MKALVCCLSALFLVSSNTPPVQAPQAADSCRFKVSGELAKPTISGPEDITALVHVVEQPDSLWKSSRLISKIHGCPLRTSV